VVLAAGAVALWGTDGLAADSQCTTGQEALFNVQAVAHPDTIPAAAMPVRKQTKAKMGYRHSRRFFVPPPPAAPPLWIPYPGRGMAVNKRPDPPVPVAERVSIVAVIGDRAIIETPSNCSDQGKTHTVAAGDRVGSLSVIAVCPDAVVIQERGKRYVRRLGFTR
jgi:hypothetical protein